MMEVNAGTLIPEHELVQTYNPKTKGYVVINKTLGLIVGHTGAGTPWPDIKIVRDKDYYDNLMKENKNEGMVDRSL